MIPNSCIPVSYVRMMGHTLSYEVSMAATWRFSKHIAVGPGTLSEKPDKCSRKQKSTRTCIPLSKGYVAYTTSLVMELTQMTSVERASSASTCPKFNTSNWCCGIRYLHHPDHVSCYQSRQAKLSVWGYHLFTNKIHQETLIKTPLSNYGRASNQHLTIINQDLPPSLALYKQICMTTPTSLQSQWNNFSLYHFNPSYPPYFLLTPSTKIPNKPIHRCYPDVDLHRCNNSGIGFADSRTLEPIQSTLSWRNVK